MQVSGEAYFFINVWMNFLSLCLAGTLCRLRLRPKKCLAAAVLGGGYALAAWFLPPWIQFPLLVAMALFMARIAFGRFFLPPLPFLFGAGFLLAGICQYGMEGGLSSPLLLLSAALFTLLICRLFRRGCIPGPPGLRLVIAQGGKRLSLPAFRDSGNLLSDPVTALPVIVAPLSLLQPLLPGEIRPGDLTTLPPSFRLLSIETAAGKKTLMAFHPDFLQLQMKNQRFRLDALIALSDFSEKRALLPEAIFYREEEKNASL